MWGKIYLEISAYEYPKGNISFTSFKTKSLIVETRIKCELFTIVDEDYYDKIKDSELNISGSTVTNFI